jgi:beta-lactamase superfamily II metal-dependent hydrolase
LERLFTRGVLLALLFFVLFSVPACRELDLLAGGPVGGPSPPPSGSLSVSFIDVGQGDSVLVQAGGEDYLIDAGQPEQGPNVVDFLRARGVDKLDGLVSSGPDADHSGGLPDVLEAFTVEEIYLSGYTSPTMTYNNTLQAMNAEKRTEDAEIVPVRAGHRMDWGGVAVDVVNPPPDSQGGLFSESNDNSVGLLLTYATARILLAGDAEEKAEEYMANGPYTGPVTVLKVTHHGSNTSSTPEFLNAFRPKIAVIQVGAENSYGHPTPETLARLKEYGAKVFRNDEDGDVIVTIKDQKVEVAVTKP